MKQRNLLGAAVLLVSTSLPAAEPPSLFDIRVLAPQAALSLARAALEACRKEDYQVAVAVVDRMGVTQVVLRDRFAGPHTPDTAWRKAWTSVSFRTDTQSMADVTKEGAVQSGARHISNALMIGGGVPVEVDGSIVGGVGVSGAPLGEIDDRCARAGIDAVYEKLVF